MDHHLIIVKKQNSEKVILYDPHQFIWECFNGIIPIGTVVKYVSDHYKINHLSNLIPVPLDDSLKNVSQSHPMSGDINKLLDFLSDSSCYYFPDYNLCLDSDSA